MATARDAALALVAAMREQGAETLGDLDISALPVGTWSVHDVAVDDVDLDEEDI